MVSFCSSACLYLPTAGIKGMYHHVQLVITLVFRYKDTIIYMTISLTFVGKVDWLWNVSFLIAMYMHPSRFVT